MTFSKNQNTPRMSNEMEFNQPLDDISFDTDHSNISVPVISLNKFIVFCVITFGLYELWWIYKSWKFFKEKENLDIMPAARAIFAIFFVYYLFEKILDFARANGYQKEYSSGGLTVLFLILNLASRLPDPFGLISLLVFLIFIQPFEAFNYAIRHSEDYRAEETNGLSTRQIVMVIIGILFWILVLIGLFFPGEGY